MDKIRAAAGRFVFAFARALHGFFGFGATCRFDPTCSQYAREAIERHGLIRGGGMALGRVARCRPGTPWGLDPVH